MGSTNVVLSQPLEAHGPVLSCVGAPEGVADVDAVCVADDAGLQIASVSTVHLDKRISGTYALGNEVAAQDLVDGGLFGERERQRGLQTQRLENDEMEERVLLGQVGLLVVSIGVDLGNEVLLHLERVGQHDAGRDEDVRRDVQVGVGGFSNGLEKLMFLSLATALRIDG